MSRDAIAVSQIRQIGGVYCLGRKLGSGSFGDIYFVVNTQTGEEFAVKLESTKSRHPMLMYEAKLLKNLQGAPGIASVQYCGVEGDFNVMIMDLLGQSLEDLFNICHRRFKLKTVLMIAGQMLHRIEYLHSRNFIHRDIKPDNFLIGHGKKINIIYLIDFGLAKQFRDSKTQRHSQYRENKTLTGTARYASINAHVGIEQSRRDDLEAIGYVLMYFTCGQLPWQGIQADTKEEKYRKITECKQSTSIDTLCKGHPKAFASYLSYCRELSFEDAPDYGYLRRLFKDLFTLEGFANDDIFDWSERIAGRECGAAVAPAAVAGAPNEKPRPAAAEHAPPATMSLNSPPAQPERPEQAAAAEATAAEFALKIAAGAAGGEDARRSASAHSAQAGSEFAARSRGDVHEEGPPPRRTPGLFASVFGCWSRKASTR